MSPLRPEGISGSALGSVLSLRCSLKIGPFAGSEKSLFAVLNRMVTSTEVTAMGDAVGMVRTNCGELSAASEPLMLTVSGARR